MSVLQQPKTLLFTSVGNEALHGFVATLRRHAPSWVLIGVDIRNDAAGRYLCDHHHTVPRRDAADFLPTLQALVTKYQVDLLVPLSTEDQDWFCRPQIYQALSPAVVLTSSETAVQIANRKSALFAHLADRPHLLPDHERVHSVAQALASITRMVGRHGAALLKSDAGTGGRGMVCIGRPSYDPAPAIGRSFMPLEVWQELAHSSAAMRAAFAPSVWGERAVWPQLVNAYLPGEEYSVDILADEGRSLAVVVRRRDAATGGLATTAEVVQAADVADAAREVVEAVGLSHVVNVQFRRDASGTPRLMEINPRIPGTIGLTVAAGADLPLAAFARAMGGPGDDGNVDDDSAINETLAIGLQCFRYYGMVLNDGRRH